MCVWCFTGPFIISIYCKNLPKSHPKHRLVAEENAHLFGFLFESHLYLRVVNDRNNEPHSHKVTLVVCIKVSPYFRQLFKAVSRTLTSAKNIISCPFHTDTIECFDCERSVFSYCSLTRKYM